MRASYPHRAEAETFMPDALRDNHVIDPDFDGEPPRVAPLTDGEIRGYSTSWFPVHGTHCSKEVDAEPVVVPIFRLPKRYMAPKVRRKTWKRPRVREWACFALDTPAVSD